MHVGYTRHDHKDAPCNCERVAAEEQVSSSDAVEAQRSVDGSLKENLFDDSQSKDLQPIRDEMNEQVEVSAQSMDD